MAKSKKAVVPSSVLRRILAFIIDMLILDFIIFTPFSAVIRKMIPNMDFALVSSALQSNRETANLIFLILTFVSFFSLLYFALLEYKLGATIGKKILGLEVVPDKGSMRFWQTIVRTLFIFPVFPFILFWIIDPLYLAMSGTNQRLLERFSMTRTIQRVNLE